jgi:hypothetical protein
MMERNHYDSGAIHNDHHKEINIGNVSESVLKDLISNFFKDDAEDAEVLEDVPGEEPDSSETPNHQEVLQLTPKLLIAESEAAKSFKFQSSFVKQKVAGIIKDFYKGSSANLALIEITLYDHNQLIKRNYHKTFVKALIAWGLMEVADEKELGKIVSAVTDKHNRMPKEGYQKWDNKHDDDKSFCEKIGGELGDTMPYKG